MAPELAVITPSFGPDAVLFEDLRRSVERYTPRETVHHVIVPDADRSLFRPFEGPRCHVWVESELLPPRYRRLKRPRAWLNVRRPWPPIRGWVLQQALKIEMTARLDVDAVLIADSDVVLVRPLTAASIIDDHLTQLHRLDDAVHAGMTRHARWHRTAHRLLGIDGAVRPPLHDYVSSLNVWAPETVRALQRRIEQARGRSWLDAFTAELDVSEFILYGVYVDHLHESGSGTPRLDPAFCHNYWGTEPLALEDALAFADALPHTAVGMMISAKSHTPLPVRRAALRRSAEIAEGTMPEQTLARGERG